MPTKINECSTAETLLMTAEEIAELLRLSVRSVWRLRSAGGIPKPLRIGSATIRWRRNEIMEWVKAGCPSLASRENGTRRK